MDAATRECRYVRQWIAVKARWSLKVNPTERRALLGRAGHCANSLLTVRGAKISRVSSTGSTSSGWPGSSGSAGLDPQFDYCYEAIAAGYGPYVQGVDPEY